MKPKAPRDGRKWVILLFAFCAGALGLFVVGLLAALYFGIRQIFGLP